jgi:hypothetical protein
MNDKDIKTGYVYHIKDEYFAVAKDDKLMKNHEGGSYRPAYLGIKDSKTNLLWVIPMSTQVKKYQRIVDKDTNRYGECLKIIIGEYNDKYNAFLLQNMFPVLPRYISHIHTQKGNIIPVYSGLQTRISRSFREVRRLHKLGIKLVFPDINRLEKLMLSEIN